MELKEAIAHVAARKDLSADQIAATFGRIMDGEATPAQIEFASFDARIAWRETSR